MANPWEGFWQILSDSEDEDVVPFKNTTIAVRKALGFVVFARRHFMEISVVGKRPNYSLGKTIASSITEWQAVES